MNRRIDFNQNINDKKCTDTNSSSDLDDGMMADMHPVRAPQHESPELVQYQPTRDRPTIKNKPLRYVKK